MPVGTLTTGIFGGISGVLSAATPLVNTLGPALINSELALNQTRVQTAAQVQIALNDQAQRRARNETILKWAVGGASVAAIGFAFVKLRNG